MGYQRFSEYLLTHERYGEALVMIDRAREIDPLAPTLRVRAAYLLRVSRSDYTGADRLLREALALNPTSYQVVTELARLHYAQFGEAADAIRWNWNTGPGLIYAHTLVLAGEADRGRKLATSILAWLDKESVGRTEHALSRSRAAAFAILGDDEHALQELEASVKNNEIARWWYTADLDPLYLRLRRDPRFLALADQARRHRLDQRVRVNEMRSRAEIPIRTLPAHTMPDAVFRGPKALVVPGGTPCPLTMPSAWKVMRAGNVPKLTEVDAGCAADAMAGYTPNALDARWVAESRSRALTRVLAPGHGA
jgi:tetratricopeptide (TPR) repeat protein